jgi:hypothetical protein
MSSSSTNIRPPSEDLNGCSHERGEHQDCSNTVLVQSQRAFEKLVLGQVSALESTFNEAMKANHPNQAHNALTCKQIEETKSRTGIPFEGIDEKSDKNCSQQNEEKSLLGKRRPSSRGIGSSSDGGASSESTFNEAMKANHPNQAHNAMTCKQIEETKSRTGIPFEGIDEKSDKNCSQQNEEKSLLGKRRPSSRGIGSSSDGGASSQRSRSFSSAPS